MAQRSYQQVRRLKARVLDLIRPEIIDKDEQKTFERRSLTFSRFKGTVLFQGLLPKLEGQILQDAITAMAEAQRAEADYFSQAQRNADGRCGLSHPRRFGHLISSGFSCRKSPQGSSS